MASCHIITSQILYKWISNEGGYNSRELTPERTVSSTYSVDDDDVGCVGLVVRSDECPQCVPSCCCCFYCELQKQGGSRRQLIESSSWEEQLTTSVALPHCLAFPHLITLKLSCLAPSPLPTARLYHLIFTIQREGNVPAMNGKITGSNNIVYICEFLYVYWKVVNVIFFRHKGNILSHTSDIALSCRFIWMYFQMYNYTQYTRNFKIFLSFLYILIWRVLKLKCVKIEISIQEI